jgi:glycosyltransferase involved in cell wall biosynthesis
MEKPLVSIGVPIYNAEEFLIERINSLVNQTYKNLEIIISDNASSDSSQKICEEFTKKDIRIKYIRQKKNMGAMWNFLYVLKNANGKYFTWAAADDLMLPEYLENNILILEAKKDIACCTSQLELFGPQTDYLKTKKSDSYIEKIKKKILQRYGYLNTFPTNGNYKKRLRQYFKKARHNQIFYSVYRTEQIKKCVVEDPFILHDNATIVNILEFGNLYVVEEKLMKTYDSGVSRDGLNKVSAQMEHGNLGKIFPYYQYTTWCFQRLGWKLFVKNIGYFLKMNVLGSISVIIAILNIRRL